MKYFVGGINGVGKTHFLGKLKELKPDYELVDGSKEFMEWLGFNDDYERLRKLIPEIRDAKLAEFISQTLNKSEAGTLVYIGHFIVLVRGEIIHVVRDWLSRFDGIVLMTARPDVIMSRISQDDRDRALFPDNTSDEQALQILKDYQLKEHVAFLELGEQFGIPKVLIDNSESNADNNVYQFLDFDARIRRSYI